MKEIWDVLGQVEYVPLWIRESRVDLQKLTPI